MSWHRDRYLEVELYLYNGKVDGRRLPAQILVKYGLLYFDEFSISASSLVFE